MSRASALLAGLILALTAACAGTGGHQAAWRAWVAAHEHDYAGARFAVLKVDDAIYLKPGERAHLHAGPEARASYRWSLAGSQADVLSVAFALDAAGAPHATLTHGATRVGDLTRYAVDDRIDIDAAPSGLGTDDPRLALKVYNHAAAAGFAGLSFYPFSPAHRIDAVFRVTDPPRAATLHTERGLIKLFYELGRAELMLDGAAVSLPLYAASPDAAGAITLSAFFADATTGTETYGVGRYLDVDAGAFPPERVIVDFNRAYNPLCARSPHFNCPLVEFAIAAPVRAGERYEAAAAH